MSETEVTLERSTHGPFERLSFVFTVPGGGRSQHAVYRLGDTVFDSGGTRVAHAVLAALADRPPRRIVCTHQHEDHVGNIPAIRRRFGHIPVWAPRAHLGIIASTTRVPGYRDAFWGHPEPTTDAEGYEPGHVFEEAGVVLEAVLTPGHTPHHVALVARARGAGSVIHALTGDIYTSKPLDAWFESAADDMAASLRRLAAHGDTLCMLPTHGRAKDDGARVMSAMADWLDREAEAVAADAARLGTRSVRAVAVARYGAAAVAADDAWSGGEIGRPAFVRSVLDPVRTLPASVP